MFTLGLSERPEAEVGGTVFRLPRDFLAMILLGFGLVAIVLLGVVPSLFLEPYLVIRLSRFWRRAWKTGLSKTKFAGDIWHYGHRGRMTTG